MEKLKGGGGQQLVYCSLVGGGGGGRVPCADYDVNQESDFMDSPNTANLKYHVCGRWQWVLSCSCFIHSLSGHVRCSETTGNVSW